MKDHVTIHWSGRAFIVASASTHLELAGPFETLDDAIVHAHGAGFKVLSVHTTIGGVRRKVCERTETT